MTGKELVCAALRGERTERTPWIPFAGCHAASLIGAKADDFLRSSDLMVKGVQAAIDRYQADGVPVVFDLQIEAETLGCDLAWTEDNPPAVRSHPLSEGTPLESLEVPPPEAGRIGIALDAARRLREANPDVALYGLITGPFTLSLHLLGTDVFTRMFDDPLYLGRVVELAAEVGRAMAMYYVQAGCDVIAVVDPMTSQIGPDQFRQFVTPFIAPLFDDIRGQGVLSSFFVCGHAQQNLEAMCECRPHNISVDENIPLDLVRDTCRHFGLSFGGNLQLTAVLLLGTTEDAERDAMGCIDIAGDTGFLLAPGCDLPYAVPPENLEAIGRLVRDPYRQETVRTLTGSGTVDSLLDMTDYGTTDHVVVDIITLDSEACTPCQYMVQAVRAIAPQFEGIVQWREHKIKQPQSIVFMASLLVKNIPTICIDGRITFVSQIPPKEELIRAIQDRINEKMRIRIQRRRATLYVLGGDDMESQLARERTQRALIELGMDVEMRCVSDETEIRSFGVHPVQTPAIVTAKYELKSAGTVPEIVAIKEWIKSIW